jgi:hypothetical protein
LYLEYPGTDELTCALNIVPKDSVTDRLTLWKNGSWERDELSLEDDNDGSLPDLDSEIARKASPSSVKQEVVKTEVVVKAEEVNDSFSDSELPAKRTIGTYETSSKFPLALIWVYLGS